MGSYPPGFEEDESAWAREVCEGATPGPWCSPESEDSSGIGLRCEVFGPRDGPRSVVVCVAAGEEARAIALLGSTWQEMLAVIEAADAYMQWSCDAYEGDAGPVLHEVLSNALSAYRAAVRAHQERSAPDDR